MKKIVAVFAVLFISFGVGAFASGAQEGGADQDTGEPSVSVTLATGDARGSLRNLMGNELVKAIESRPELNISVNHVEGPVLGAANEIMDQVVEGSVDVFGNDLAWVAPYDDDFLPMSFGFVFRDIDHYQKYLASEPFADIVDRVAEDAGLRLVSATPMNARLYFSTEPLNTADDFQGLKMRAPGLKMFVETYKAYGMRPTTIAWNEIFLALRTGVADAAQGPAADVVANDWHLAAPHITRLDDMFAANGWYVNEEFWQSLTENQREGMIEAFAEVNDWGFAEAINNEQEILNKMVEEDDAIYNDEFEEAERLRLRERALEAARDLEESGEWSAGLIDQINALQ
ncbi:MAG: TRAP transporter substrate-binding protein [Balneolaceae bacterium]